jgi:hypothetical protein
VRRLLFLAVAFAPFPDILAAQSGGRVIELHMGRWWVDEGVRAYELRATYPLAGIFTHALSANALVHDRLGRNRAFYGLGYELHAFRVRGTVSPYALAGIAMGLSTDTSSHELGAVWTLGAGAEWRPVSWVVFGAEGRYRVEDRGPRGFWRLRPDARKGLSVSLGFGIHFGPSFSRDANPRAERPVEVPRTISGHAADVVRTALQVLGTPYQWGGTAENGFDCSGLIHYAYGQFGIRLPRLSREQARSGVEVPPVVSALEPGDVLLFAAKPGGGVTHVGMYVAERTFIHSSSSGVRLSRLDPKDPEASWWLPRWVGARRIVQ